MYENLRDFAGALGQLAAFFATVLVVVTIFLLEKQKTPLRKLWKKRKVRAGLILVGASAILLIFVMMSATTQILYFVEGQPLDLDRVGILLALYNNIFVGSFLGGLFGLGLLGSELWRSL